MKFKFPFFAVTLAVAVSLAPSARALVISSGNGTGNFTDPGYSLPWDNVGKVNGASGVYLGQYGADYWVMTATHVGLGSIVLGNTTYTAVSGSAVQIGGDLTIYRISTDPGLSNLALATSGPAVNNIVTMVGFGRVEQTFTKWNVDTGTNPFTWTTTNSPIYNASGYTSQSNGNKRWSFGDVGAINLTYNVGTGVTSAYSLSFSDGPFTITPSAASFNQSSVEIGMAQVGDSGGAIFIYDGSDWLLSGIMGAIGLFSGQPSNTGVYGDVTYGINLAAYDAQLTAVLVPEPAVTALFAGLLACWLVRRRRQSQ